MRTISINVPPHVADAFEKADEALRRKAEIYINAWLDDYFSNKAANKQLFEIMKRATAIAKENGYSDDALQDLLNKDE